MIFQFNDRTCLGVLREPGRMHHAGVLGALSK
jgi:hypothetical protein